MAIRKLTPEEEAIKELENKNVFHFMKEGLTVEEAKAAVEALKEQLKNKQNGTIR
jgi:hypothetical protein